MTTPSAAVRPSADDLVGRIFGSLVGAMDLFSIYLGDRLGYYAALTGDLPITSTQLAGATDTDERYAREWLEQQSVSGFLACENPGAPAAERTYILPAEYHEIFTVPDSLYGMAQAAQIFAGTVKPLAQLLEAYRTGAGVPFEDYGDDMGEGQARFTKPMFVNLMTQEWLPAIPDIHARLQAHPPARVADIGMGHGWSSINIARGYPNVQVDGFDLDKASVIAATANASAAGVSHRVSFQARDAGDPDLAGRYDFAIAIECVHDMSNPVAVLSAMRRLVGPGGTVLIVDENVSDRFEPDGSEVERFMYGFSILHCLPVGRVEQPSVATGTVMRTETFTGYANEAGFKSVEVVPIENDFFRFYRLTG